MYKLVVLCALFALASAHMSIYVPSMWGSEPSNPNSNWAVNPLENLNFKDWWMHGPKSLNDPPQANAITQLPAGGTIDFEIGTNKAFTSMGRGLWHSPGKSSRVPPDPWSNTGSEWPSNLHSPKRSDVAGCALGIAYKSDVNSVNPEDFVIMSVARDCVARALQAFDIPYLPACPNGKCICSWFWVHNSIGGTDQMYMTPFQCNVTNASKRVIGKPVPPVRCDGQPACYLYPNWGNKTTVCNKVQQPMYWANNERNNMANPSISNIGDTLISQSNVSRPSTIGSSPATQLATPSCQTKLVVQNDGNVVFSDVNNGRVYWSTGTANKGTGPFRFVTQNDGNLVLSDSKNTVLWSSGTTGQGCAPYQLKVRDVAKLTLVDCNSEPLWAANSK